MILDAADAAHAVESRLAALLSVGLDAHTARAAVEGPGPHGTPDQRARGEDLLRHLAAIDGAIGRWVNDAPAFRGAVVELNARLMDLAARREVDGEGLENVRRNVEGIAHGLDARARHRMAVEELAASLDAEATKAGRDLGRHIDPGCALVLAAFDLRAARLAALALGADGLAGDPRSELTESLNLTADLGPALALGDAPARLGPAMARAVTAASEALIRQRVQRRLDDEHAAKVAALATEERASLDASIATGRAGDAGPIAPSRPRRRAVT